MEQAWQSSLYSRVFVCASTDLTQQICWKQAHPCSVRWQVVPGQTSENFRRHPLPNLAQASFSMLYTDTDQSVRTLDLTCRSQQEYELWYWGLNVSWPWAAHSTSHLELLPCQGPGVHLAMSGIVRTEAIQPR